MGISAGVRIPWAPAIGLIGLVGMIGPAILARKRSAALVMGMVGVGLLAGWLLILRSEQARQVELPRGEVVLLVESVGDGRGPPGRGWVTARVVAVEDAGGRVRSWQGPPGRLRGDVSRWRRTGRWWVRTVMQPTGPPADRRELLGGPVWTGDVSTARPAGVAGGWLGARVAGVRSVVIRRLAPAEDPGRALLAGFLLGDTSHLSETEREWMRRAGLSHFVAVSGSNVALFLTVLFVLVGPLGWNSRRRAVVGIAGLLFFVTLVGPDPSVVRAATMAGLVLVARPFGLRPDAWVVVGVGVALLLLVSPELAFSLGFQLSVAATVGVMVGAGWFEQLEPRWLRVSLGASCGAQLAVAPILLVAVGSVPLWSPVANLAAAPLVVAATGIGAAGAVLGTDLLVAAAAAGARAVLTLARLASPLPQLAWPASVLLIAAAAAGVRWPRFRPATILILAVAVASLTISFPPGNPLTPAIRPAFAALDVGQGDALLLLGEGGETVLVDGGSSGLKVRDGLSRFGVRAIDLLIVSHAHHDHYGGLVELVGAVPIGALWHAPFPGQGDPFLGFIEAASSATNVHVPGPGLYRVGSISLEVIGPVRRYASPNDQSIVVVATLGGTRILLSGDIERIAQRDLEPPRVDVLKVPHQGAATSDPDWLVATGARTAVVSVGPNRFGHPSPDLLAHLRSAGMEVRRTDLEGDVVIRPGR